VFLAADDADGLFSRHVVVDGELWIGGGVEVSLASLTVRDGGVVRIGHEDCPVSDPAPVRLNLVLAMEEDGDGGNRSDWGRLQVDEGGALYAHGSTVPDSHWPLGTHAEQDERQLHLRLPLSAITWPTTLPAGARLLVTDSDYTTSIYKSNRRDRTYADIVTLASPWTPAQDGGDTMFLEANLTWAHQGSERDATLAARVAPLDRPIVIAPLWINGSGTVVGSLDSSLPGANVSDALIAMDDGAPESRGWYSALSGRVELDGVRLVGGGQAERERYPLHLVGAGASHSIVARCVIEASFFRGITLERVTDTLIHSNVLHTIEGHGIALATGTEMGHRFHANLVSSVYRADTRVPFRHDRDEVAGFHITNPSNVWASNVVAGNAEVGYSFTMPYRPIGSFAVLFPDERWRWPLWRFPLLQFVDNVAAGVEFGLRLGSPLKDHDTDPDQACCQSSWYWTPSLVQFPLTDEWAETAGLNLSIAPSLLDSPSSSEPVVRATVGDEYGAAQRQIIFTRLTTHHCSYGVYAPSLHLQFHGYRASDNQIGFQAYRSLLHDAHIVGDSGWPGNPPTGYLATAPYAGYERRQVGVRTWNSGSPHWYIDVRLFNFTTRLLEVEPDPMSPKVRVSTALSFHDDELQSYVLGPQTVMNLGVSIDEASTESAITFPTGGLGPVSTNMIVDGSGSFFANSTCGDVYLAADLPFIRPRRSADAAACIPHGAPADNVVRCPASSFAHSHPRLFRVYDVDRNEICGSCSDDTACNSAGGCDSGNVVKHRFVTSVTRLSDRTNVDLISGTRIEPYFNAYTSDDYYVVPERVPTYLRVYGYYFAPTDQAIFHIAYPTGMSPSDFEVRSSRYNPCEHADTLADLTYVRRDCFHYEPSTGILSMHVGRPIANSLDSRHFFGIRSNSVYAQVRVVGSHASCTADACVRSSPPAASSVPRAAHLIVQAPILAESTCKLVGVPRPPIQRLLDIPRSVDDEGTLGRTWFRNGALGPNIVILQPDLVTFTPRAAFTATLGIRFSMTVFTLRADGTKSFPSLLEFSVDPKNATVTPALTTNSYLHVIMRVVEADDTTEVRPIPFADWRNTFFPLRGSRGSDDTYTDTFLGDGHYGKLCNDVTSPATSVAHPLADGWVEMMMPLADLAAESDALWGVRIQRSSSDFRPDQWVIHLDTLEIVDVEAPDAVDVVNELVDEVEAAGGASGLDDVLPFYTGFDHLGRGEVPPSVAPTWLRDTRLFRPETKELVLLPASAAGRWRATLEEPADAPPSSKIVDFDKLASYYQSRYGIPLEKPPPAAVSNEHVNIAHEWYEPTFLDALWTVVDLPATHFVNATPSLTALWRHAELAGDAGTEVEAEAETGLDCVSTYCVIMGENECAASVVEGASCADACAAMAPAQLPCYLRWAEMARVRPASACAHATFNSSATCVLPGGTEEQPASSGSTSSSTGTPPGTRTPPVAFFRTAVSWEPELNVSSLTIKLATSHAATLFVDGHEVYQEPWLVRPFAYWTRELSVPLLTEGTGDDRAAVHHVAVAVRAVDPSALGVVEAWGVDGIAFDAEILAVIGDPVWAAPYRTGLEGWGEGEGEGEGFVHDDRDLFDRDLVCEEGERGCSCNGDLACARPSFECREGRCVDTQHRTCPLEAVLGITSGGVGTAGCPCAPPAGDARVAPYYRGEQQLGLGFPGGNCTTFDTVCSDAGFCVASTVCPRGTPGCLCRSEEVGGARCDEGSGCALVVHGNAVPGPLVEVCVEGYLGYTDVAPEQKGEEGGASASAALSLALLLGAALALTLA
jgi:hypothetical protein